MTLKQWDANPEHQRELAELLRNPILAAALELVRQKGLTPITPPAGSDIVQYGAMMGFKRDGYFEALQNLTGLGQPPTPRVAGVKHWEEPVKEKPATTPVS
jgi:hypothetical protein